MELDISIPLRGVQIAINFPNFRIMEVSKDAKGRYMKLEIQLPDGLSIIRWDLDQFTYTRIKELVSKNTLIPLQQTIDTSCYLMLVVIKSGQRVFQRLLEL